MSEAAPATDRSAWHALARIGRRVAPSVTEVVTGQSRWLFDAARSRFQRCSLRQHREQAVAFGAWQPLARVEVYDDRVLVVQPVHAPAVRIDLRPGGLLPRSREPDRRPSD